VPPLLPLARRALLAGLIPYALTVSLGSALAGGAVATARVVLLGRSIEGRPIDAVEIGDSDSPRKELVVGCIHGNEPAGIAIARRLEQSAPRGIDLWLIPNLNPDGRVANTRDNARGVDLNRNFPWRWRRLSGVYYSGPHPLSEPESRIAFRFLRRLRPRVSIWFHQHEDVVDESGGKLAIERRFAALVGLPLARLAREPGSAVTWENHAFPGTTTFVVELPAGALTAAATARYARAVVDVGERP
jgi:protein MpaA